MRGDNIIVGKPVSSKPASTVAGDPAERASLSSLAADTRNSLKKPRPDVCGAMSQQRSDTGSQSTPQKFVRLVGCHDPSIKPQPKR